MPQRSSLLPCRGVLSFGRSTGDWMKRRAFITLLGGAVAGWPLAARAQQPGGRRRLAVLMATAADDPESRKRLFALLQSMQQLGWVEGRNLRIDIRWAAGNTDDTRKYAAELIALTPDIILAAGSLALGPLLQATRTIPIVFTHVPDPVGAGFVDSMAQRGRLHRSHPQGRKAGGPAGSAVHKARASGQPQDREGARPRSAANPARPRRRGD